jgi:hypothetical protein
MRRRLEPVERALPVKLPGYEAGGPGSAGGEDSQALQADPTTRAAGAAPEDAAARIDAARTRLRATIDPPADPDI